MSMRNRLSALLATVGLAAGLVVTLAGPAGAATPHCHGTSSVHVLGNGYNEYDVMPTRTPNDMNWRCVLAIGDGYVGDQYYAVWYLQRSLHACYGQEIAIDGKYGPQTAEAVKNVQRFHNSVQDAGLAVDGVYGPNTAYYMEYQNTLGRCWTKT
ncbi:peptidoglycan-binding domain-containing protein [Streptomyces aidingensis]|uniref:Putative peptidoglycan binding domain-containing protein n=1 Tax=Streptomyces aidingensis TaxID=910347 RepID=A0A1I1K9M5_9ACTN|nr:peptidoglycan-binding domain-containing protein [Streptomyces aidingensis]SFC54823.1 Putative peptidoglycan binding domain-containing protein [Streptomyces aidingensis]